jgi:hypothetical protein
MIRMQEALKSLVGRSFVLALILCISTAAFGADMAQWAVSFDGVTTGLGPYAWVDGPTFLANHATMEAAVNGGQSGDTILYVCRAVGSDGTHPGKFFNKQCNIGWGGKEYTLTANYELLVNTYPRAYAKYFPQTWVSRLSNEGNQYPFYGGLVGTQKIRPCRAFYNNGTHPGKEWGSNCLIGWGGNEVSVSSYEVLNLRFDKQAWTAAGSPNPASNTSDLSFLQYAQIMGPQNLSVSGTPVFQVPPPPPLIEDYYKKIMEDFSAARIASSKTNWTPGYLGTGFSNLANTLPALMYSIIDEYNDNPNVAAANKKDRTTVFNGLVSGNTEAQAFMALLIANRAKVILDKPQSSWTVEELGLINYILALSTEQRLKAAGQAKNDFEAWKSDDRTGKTVGLAALTYTPSKPPGAFLAMARGGYAITGANAPNFSRIIVTAAALTAGAAGVTAAIVTGAGSTIMIVVSSGLATGSQIASMIGSSFAVAGATAGFAASVALVAALVTSGIVKGVELAEYQKYVTDMDAAIADSKTPLTVDQLRANLNNGEGFTRVFYWLAAQASTGTTS